MIVVAVDDDLGVVVVVVVIVIVVMMPFGVATRRIMLPVNYAAVRLARLDWDKA